MGFETVVGKAVAYLDLDTSGFERGIQTAMGQMSVLTDSEATFSQKLSTVGTGMQTVGRSLTRNVTTPIALGMGFATKRTMDFEEAMSNVQALLGKDNATPDVMDKLHDKALELGAATKYTSKEVADAFGYMALAGWDATQMTEGIAGVLDLAASSGMDLANASDLVTDYLTAFGKEAAYSTTMADMLSYAQANSNTTTQQLGEAFGNSAALMHGAGQEMSTVVAILGAMANAGTKGSEAGTALSATMRDIYQKMFSVEDATMATVLAEDGLVSSTGNMNDLIGQQVIQIGKWIIPVSDLNGNFRDLVDIMFDVGRAVDGLGTSEATAALSTTFTSRSIKAVNEILQQGATSIDQFRLDIASQGAGIAALTDQTLNKVTNEFEESYNKIGKDSKKFRDHMKEFLTLEWGFSDETADKMIDKFLEMKKAGVSSTDAIKQGLSEIGGGYAAETAETMMDNLAGSITKLTSAIDVFMVKVGERLAPYIRQFADWLTELTSKIDALSDDEFDQIVKIGLIVAAAGPLLSIGGKILTGISSIITFVGNLGPLVSGVIGIAKGGMSIIHGAISGIGTIGTAVFGGIKTVISGIGTIGATVFNGIGTIASSVFGGIKTLISGIGTAASTVFNGLLSLVKTVFGAIGTAIKTAIGFVTEFASTIGGIVAIIAGVVIAAKAFFDMWNEGFTWAKELVMLLGIALVAVGAIILGAPAAIAGVIAAIVAVVSTAAVLIHQHWDQIKEWWTNLVEGIKQKWDEFWQKAHEKIEEFKEKFRERIERIKEAWEGFWDKAHEIVDKLKQRVHDKIEEIKEGVRERVEKIKEHWEQTWDKFKDKVEEIKEKVKEKVEELKEKAVEKIIEMKDKFIERFEELKEKAIDKFNEMKEKTIEKFQEMREKAEQKVQEMKEKVWEKIQDIKEKFVDKIEDMKKDAIEKFEKLKEEVKTKVENMKTALVQKFEELRDQGKEKLQALHDSLSELGEKIREKFDKLKESVGEAIKKFKDVGKDLINNILDGLKSAWEALKKWVEDKFGWIGEKVSGIVDKAKDFLNIGSSASSNSSMSSSKVSTTSGKTTTTTTKAGTTTSSKTTSNYGDTYNFYGKVNDPYENARDVKNAKRAAEYT